MRKGALEVCTEEVFIFSYMGLIDTPGGVEWKRLVKEGSMTPAKVLSAIDKAQRTFRSMSVEEIESLWKV